MKCFIKNIKELIKTGKVRDDNINVELQCIISSHSSHIVSESDFNDIKYLMKKEVNGVISKNLRDLEREYEVDGEEKSFRFLKQYLTLHRSELVFADKAILLEGDTERILLPTILKKQDAIHGKFPLMSQNISIVEVGAHSKIFEKLLAFLEIKVLIITDIDSFYLVPKLVDDGVTIEKTKEGKDKTESIICPASDPKAEHTSNYSLVYFFNNNSIQYLNGLNITDKSFTKKDGNWIPDVEGKLAIVYQTNEDGYTGRSFEDTFFHINSKFIKDENNSFDSLTDKWLIQYKKDEITAFGLSQSGVGSKPSLAIEILLNGARIQDEAYTDWVVPKYISEGLEWLRGDL